MEVVRTQIWVLSNTFYLFWGFFVIVFHISYVCFIFEWHIYCNYVIKHWNKCKILLPVNGACLKMFYAVWHANQHLQKDPFFTFIYIYCIDFWCCSNLASFFKPLTCKCTLFVTYTYMLRYSSSAFNPSLKGAKFVVVLFFWPTMNADFNLTDF